MGPTARTHGDRRRVTLAVVTVFLIGLLGGTATAAAWHSDHASDTACAVCKLRHQPIDALVSIDTLGSRPLSDPTCHARESASTLRSPCYEHRSPRAPPASAIV